MKDFSELSEQELLALAISLEEEDARIYDEFAEGLHETYPDTARMFRAMADEETGHRHRLLDLYRTKFGDRIPLIRCQDVRGFVERKPVWLSRPLSLDTVREQAELMEAETKRFCSRAARRSRDAIRQLLGDLAAEERRHEAKAEELAERYLPADVRAKEHEAERRLFLLQIIQPGLVGLMDGSVSTLAPLFMTALGGLGHPLPYLIPDFRTATRIAIAVVLIELAAIAWIRRRYLETPFFSAALQVVVGGLCLRHGVAIGSS